MKPILLCSALAVCAALSTGCYYDKQELLDPGSTCDTTAVTYSLTVKPILSNYCFACHGNSTYASLGENINLESYNGLVQVVNSGLFMKSIRHEAGASPMPDNAPQLSPCNITKLDKWVRDGALNN